MPSELVFGTKTLYNNEDVASYGEYADGLRARMQHAHRVARTHFNNAAKRNKAIYDTRVAHNSYKVGDVVWLLSENRKVAVADKLIKTYEGPYLVKQNVNNINCVIQRDKAGKDKLVHHDKTKPYEGVSPSKWVDVARKKLAKNVM